MAAKKKVEIKKSVGKPRAYPTVEDMIPVIDEYFEKQEKAKRPLTKAGLAEHLGIARDTLVEYSKREGYADTLKVAYGKIERYLVESALTGETQHKFTQFLLQSCHDYNDKPKVDETKDQLIAALLNNQRQYMKILHEPTAMRTEDDLDD